MTRFGPPPSAVLFLCGSTGFHARLKGDVRAGMTTFTAAVGGDALRVALAPFQPRATMVPVASPRTAPSSSTIARLPCAIAIRAPHYRADWAMRASHNSNKTINLHSVMSMSL